MSKSIPIFQVDAFAERRFEGNPAAVCPLDEWLADDLMQRIALENNLSETAFFVKGHEPIDLRWFTPTTEVELCGHATLATAHVLRNNLGFDRDTILFKTLSGRVSVEAQGDDRYTLDFPTDTLNDVPGDLIWIDHFHTEIIEAYRGTSDYLFVVPDTSFLRKINPNFASLALADGRGFIVTCRGENCDYVSRCFYPQAGINEDPATGSSQTTLAPYWATQLGKTKFISRQLSDRGAYFETELKGERTLITGKAVSYLQGEVFI